MSKGPGSVSWNESGSLKPTSHCLICQNLNINCVFVCAAAVGGGLQGAEKLLTLDGIATTTAGLNTIEAELDLCITYLSLNFTLYS